uniref:WAS/WASL-interacting protein family member 3-like n=1 Tax=Davidia involucrata TaxID=16924 RepID=A0A5B7BTU3_DAVIN
MSEGPKLYSNKPKKAHLKQQLASPSPSSSSSSSMATQHSSKTPPPPPPPEPPKESFVRRNKFIWPLLLAVNFAVGAYLFMRTKSKEAGIEGGEVPDTPVTSVSTTAPATGATAPSTGAASEKPLSAPPPLVEPMKLREPIPENKQRELFKWLLEEKRKVKPKDPEEKKRIDEEKAIIKKFIRAKSIPSI